MIVTMARRRAHVPESIPAGQFKAKCLEIMDGVRASGRGVVVTKRGVPVVRVVPAVARPKTLWGTMPQIEIAGDIVSPISEDWEALR
jgi:prevent-host-death family protein